MDPRSAPEWRGFLRAIIAEPDDDTARLVAADWLEERSDDDKYSSFIRVQVELAKVERGPCRCTFSHHNRSSTCARCKEAEPLRRRSRELATPVNQSAWLGFAGSCFGWLPVWRRGFVEEVRCPCASWEAHGRAVYAAQPLTKVVLTDAEVRGARLRRHTGWRAYAPGGVEAPWSQSGLCMTHESALEHFCRDALRWAGKEG